MSLGRNIRRIRRAQDITQMELAQSLSISQSLLCQIERGTKNATVELAIDIAGALGVSITELIGDDAHNQTA
ncbi:helix-turn-helix domain-containing protein [Eubacteriales bacterium OttesenSCG-928-N13]|nr:helix-turn-helix domain-containing protein [Eubacteriales bacterium OttesenSCG-928-N13]